MQWQYQAPTQTVNVGVLAGEKAIMSMEAWAPPTISYPVIILQAVTIQY